MTVWVVSSIPLWAAAIFSLALGALTCVVGGPNKRPLPLGQDVLQTTFGVVLTASGSGFCYLAAKLCGY